MSILSGYGKLSPKTALGKVATMIYAIIGVPLMLILLSAFGSLLASGARKSYTVLCCHKSNTDIKSPAVGYHKARSSPSGRHSVKHLEGKNRIPRRESIKLDISIPMLPTRNVALVLYVSFCTYRF